MELSEIEHKIAQNEMSAAQVFTQMKQHIDCDSELKNTLLEQVASELFKLSKKYKNSDKKSGVQDAYAHIVGMKNSIIQK